MLTLMGPGMHLTLNYDHFLFFCSATMITLSYSFNKTSTGVSSLQPQEQFAEINRRECKP